VGVENKYLKIIVMLLIILVTFIIIIINEYGFRNVYFQRFKG
jgi:hypothetical protein